LVQGLCRPDHRRQPLKRKGRPRGRPFRFCDSMRMRGLEPPRDCSHSVLSAARLPIPPHPQTTSAHTTDPPEDCQGVGFRISARCRLNPSPCGSPWRDLWPNPAITLDLFKRCYKQCTQLIRMPVFSYTGRRRGYRVKKNVLIITVEFSGNAPLILLICAPQTRVSNRCSHSSGRVSAPFHRSGSELQNHTTGELCPCNRLMDGIGLH
jgi:hypothetical protein